MSIKKSVPKDVVIYVVDDDAGMRTGRCRLLEAVGYETRAYAVESVAEVRAAGRLSLPQGSRPRPQGESETPISVRALIKVAADVSGPEFTCTHAGA